MSYHILDEDEYEVVVTSTPCIACGGDLRKCTGACSGSFSIEQRRRAPEDVARIKAARRRQREDDVLAEAVAIQARRAKETPNV